MRTKGLGHQHRRPVHLVVQINQRLQLLVVNPDVGAVLLVHRPVGELQQLAGQDGGVHCLDIIDLADEGTGRAAEFYLIVRGVPCAVLLAQKALVLLVFRPFRQGFARQSSHLIVRDPRIAPADARFEKGLHAGGPASAGT